VGFLDRSQPNKIASDGVVLWVGMRYCGWVCGTVGGYVVLWVGTWYCGWVQMISPQRTNTCVFRGHGWNIESRQLTPVLCELPCACTIYVESDQMLKSEEPMMLCMKFITCQWTCLHWNVWLQWRWSIVICHCDTAKWSEQKLLRLKH